MIERTQTKKRNRKKAEKRGRTRAVIIVCCLMLISGFFYAGRQHFSAMDYGMKNSRLRKQIDELDAEKRRLILAREVSLSPAEIKKAAKKAGLTDQTASDYQMARLASVTREKADLLTVSRSKTMILKTAAAAPVQTTVAASYSKPEKPGIGSKPPPLIK